MSDDLRTRISNIARDHFDASCQCPGVPEMRSYRDACDHVADEVIRELGMTQERKRHSHPSQYRYVTDWKADDE